MHVLITGGAGFIGSHLAERLLREGHQVTAVDDLSTGTVQNLGGCAGQPRFAFVREDVRNSECMHVLVAQADVVVHLAAAVGVQLIVDRPVHTIETNIHGTEVVLALCNKFRRKVLVASSSEVYGKSGRVPFREDDDTVMGSTRFSRWAYACSKAIDEFLALAYHQEEQLEVVIARFFNTVGPRQTGRYGMVVPRFAQAAIRDEPLVIYGSGQQSRCFCHVADVVEAVLLLLREPAAVGRVFNVGTTEEVTIEQLADRIIAAAGSSSPKRFLSYEEAYGRPFDDMMRRQPDTSRLRDLTGWQPQRGLDQTLADVIEDCQGRQGP